MADTEVDVLVVGSGVGALTAAITAAHGGLRVLVTEKEDCFGGTSARSGGWLWIPGNHLAEAAGVQDDVAQARRYLQALAGPTFDAARVDAFLAGAPRMLRFLEQSAGLGFVLGAGYPDYEGAMPGAAAQGRSLFAAPFDGRRLGAQLQHLARPMRESTFLGIAFNTGPELRHFFRATRSFRSAWFVARRLTQQLIDVAIHGRSVRLVNGNALAAALLRAALDRDITLWRGAPLVELLRAGKRITGALVRRDGRLHRVQARLGVVLGTGGFSHDAPRVAELFPHVRSGAVHGSLTAPGSGGDGIRLATQAGGAFDAAIAHPAAWAPVSVFTRRDGSRGTYFHLIDRGKPGVIAVSPMGRRFVNESDSYHRFVAAMLTQCQHGQQVYAWLLCDHEALRKYGLGAVRPAPLPIGAYLRSGYLLRAPSIAALAGLLDIDAATLGATVEGFNRAAASGEDPEFGKGSSAYNRMTGDVDHRPNPCLRPLDRGPYYAVKLIPGDLGTFAGLRTDPQARVLTADSSVIPGLYAVGNDAVSVGGGSYPGAGAMLAPAMTFGYLCGLHLADLQTTGSAGGGDSG